MDTLVGGTTKALVDELSRDNISHDGDCGLNGAVWTKGVLWILFPTLSSM